MRADEETPPSVNPAATAGEVPAGPGGEDARSTRASDSDANDAPIIRALVAKVAAEPELAMDPTREKPYHSGIEYSEFLAFVARTLSARLYLEIGTRTGDSLRRIDCAAISIDPELRISSDVVGKKPICHFYQMSSDAFFRTHDIDRVYGQKISLAFLDGLHRFEFLLRDFINVEKHCERGSVIIMHDCHPINVEMTERVFEPERRCSPRTDLREWWTGDVWKLMPILRRYRPDMKIIHVDCPPTGLVICTNLDPSSKTLADEYFNILVEFGDLNLGDYDFTRLCEEFRVEDSHALSREENFTKRFWL